MKRKIFVVLTIVGMVFCTTSFAHALLIDFAGGTAFDEDGSSQTTDNMNTVRNVDYYVEDGMKIDFIGLSNGFIGDFYRSQDSVLHAHWDGGNLRAIEFSMLDGSLFNLNRMAITSNTRWGGMASTGEELIYLSKSDGSQILLPSSDWGIDYLMDGSQGDGVEEVLFDNTFHGISSFTITSDSGYCFGISDFEVDPVPEPATMVLFSIGLAGLTGAKARKKLKNRNT